MSTTKLKCQFTDCDWETEHSSEAVAIALLASHGNVHIHAPATESRSKQPKVDRPELVQDITDEDWESFTEEWRRFKRSWYTPSTAQVEVTDQLLQCCEQNLRRLLVKQDPTISSSSEEDVLSSMRDMAVIKIAASVRRTKLMLSRQEHGVPIREFYANTRAAAATCNYNVKCCHSCCDGKTPVDFTPIVVKDVVLAGMADSEIRREVMGMSDLDAKTAKEVVAIVEEKEMARDACFDSSDVHGVSAYRRNRNKPTNQVNEGTKGKLSLRGKCSQCNKDMNLYHRFSSGRMNTKPFKLCQTCFKASSNNRRDSGLSSSETGALSSFVGTVKVDAQRDNCPQISSIVLDHHIFSGGAWKRATKFQHPKLKIQAYVNQVDYDCLGVSVPSCSKPVVIEVVPDSGAQSCLWSRESYLAAGFKIGDLIKVHHKMSAANSIPIKIDGAVILRLKAESGRSNAAEAAVMVYISPDSPSFFLSKEAMVQLGIISASFPQVGNSLSDEDGTSESQAAASSAVTPDVAPCGCLKRSKPPGKPDKLPFDCTPQNVERMKSWLLDRYAASSFNKCPHQELPYMSGPPIKLHISEDAVPVNCQGKCPPVPAHWVEEVKSDIDQDTALKVIESVPNGIPTTWCHRMVLVRKPNGKPRRSIDLSPLNKYCVREVHPSKSPFNLAHSVPQNTYKSVLDAWNGYHSVPICEEDRHLTTFATPWGLYRYIRAPQGFLSSGDGYCRRFDHVTSHIDNLKKCVDDSLLFDESLEDHWWNVIEFVEVCGNNGIVLNKEKFQFSLPTVDFAGFRITPDAVEPSPKHLEAISSYPTPKNITDMRSYFGLVNQVAHYAKLRDMMAPFRKFLSPKVPFEWTDDLEETFTESKKHIVEAIKEGVRIFDPTRRTALRTDWSKSGVGFLLIQKQCSCLSTSPGCCENGWHIILAGSRHLTPTESNYAPIEGEALAVVWALQQTHYFTMGCDDLVVVVDHRPLVKIFGDRSLDEIPNPRLMRLKQKTLRWYFQMEYQPGKSNHFADATSRRPSAYVDHFEDPSRDKEEEHIVAALLDDVDRFFAVTRDMVKAETTCDPSFQLLLGYIKDGFPDSVKQTSHEIAAFWSFRHHLSSSDGVIIYNDRLVIPPALRQRILMNLHSAHQGTTGMITRAQASVFWPGITDDIRRTREHCKSCNRNAPSQPRLPAESPSIPKTPFEKIVADYCSFHGKKYLVIADRLSGWTEVVRIQPGGQTSGAKGLCSALRSVFASFGVPEEISSDGGPEFVAEETQQFLKKWGSSHRLSSAYFPQSNGRAELAVKATKRLLEDNTDSFGNLNTDKFVCALLQHRNTPDRDCLLSPAEILFGRRLKDSVPQLSSSSIFENTLFHRHWHQAWAAKESAMKSRLVRSCERLNEHTKNLEKLKVGDLVFIQNQNSSSPAFRKWDRQGTIVELRDFNQYLVKVAGSGQVTLRNRQFLRRIKERSQQCLPLITTHGSHPHVVSQSPPVVVPPVHPMDCTAEQADQSSDVGTPVDSDTLAEEIESESPNIQKDPLMLRNLLTYNNPGLTEQQTTGEYPVGLEEERWHINDGDLPRRSSRANKGNRKLYDANSGTYE